jgi:type II secretory pathway component PulF
VAKSKTELPLVREMLLSLCTQFKVSMLICVVFLLLDYFTYLCGIMERGERASISKTLPLKLMLR